MPKHHHTSPDGYTAERIIGWILFLFLVGGMIALLVLDSQTRTRVTDIETHLDDSDPVRNTTCDPPAPANQCSKGYSFIDGNGVKTCTTYFSGQGEACTNTQCFIENTTDTYCNSDHVCVSDNATECKGYCAIDTLSADWPIVEYNAAQCDGGINGYQFYTKDNTLQSSCDVLQWAWFYTNGGDGLIHGDCQAIGGCTYYAFKMALYVIDSPVFFSFNEPGSLSCHDFLNMTTAEQACLTITELPMSGDQANLYWTSMWATYNSDQTVPGANFSSSLCVYQYACAGKDVDAYTQTHYLLGGKRRSLLKQESVEEEWVAGRRKDDLMERAMPLGIKQGALHMEKLTPAFAAMRRGQELRAAEAVAAQAEGRTAKRALSSACTVIL